MHFGGGRICAFFSCDVVCVPSALPFSFFRYRLSVKQLREELSHRGQAIEGDAAVLHDRLLRYELNALVPAEPSQRAREDAPMGLRPPAAMPVQPDSPGPLLHDYSGDRVNTHRTPSPVTSSPSCPADASDATGFNLGHH